MKPFLVAEIPYGPNGFTLLLADLTQANKSYGESVLSSLPSIGEGTTKQAIYVSRLSRQIDSGREGRECLALVGVDVTSMPAEQADRIQWKLTQLLDTLEEETRSINNLSRRLNVAALPLLETWESDLKVVELPGYFTPSEATAMRRSFALPVVLIVVLIVMCTAAISLWRSQPKAASASQEPKTNEQAAGGQNTPEMTPRPQDNSTAPSVPTPPPLLIPNQAYAYVQNQKESLELPVFVKGLADAFETKSQNATLEEQVKISNALVETGKRWVSSQLSTEADTVAYYGKFAEVLSKLDECLRPLNGSSSAVLQRAENVGKSYDECCDRIIGAAFSNIASIWEKTSTSSVAVRDRVPFPDSRDLDGIRQVNQQLLVWAQQGSSRHSALLAAKDVIGVLKRIEQEQVLVTCRASSSFKSVKITSDKDHSIEIDDRGNGKTSLKLPTLMNATSVGALNFNNNDSWSAPSPQTKKPVERPDLRKLLNSSPLKYELGNGKNELRPLEFEIAPQDCERSNQLLVELHKAIQHMQTVLQ